MDPYEGGHFVNRTAVAQHMIEPSKTATTWAPTSYKLKVGYKL